MKNFFTLGFIMFCLLGYSQDLPFLNDENLPSENQSLNILSNYENGIKKITKFHKNGQMSQQGYLKKNKLHGKWISYSETGERICIANYDYGKKHGVWLFWENETLKEIVYENNKVINKVIWDKSGS